MKFCSSCGGSIAFRIPDGDNLPRAVCDACETVFYQNPRPIVGTIPVHEGRVLLCKRAIEPRYGYWTLPSGFMENGETVEEGAARETWEEARAQVKIQRLHTLYSLPSKGQVYMLFLADLPDPVFEAGPESLEVELVEPSSIPWKELAFSSVVFALENWVRHGNETVEPFLGSLQKSG